MAKETGTPLTVGRTDRLTVQNVNIHNSFDMDNVKGVTDCFSQKQMTFERSNPFIKITNSSGFFLFVPPNV